MTPTPKASESNVQANVRLRAAQMNKRLFRNNVGVLQDITGRPVRYGLANESKALNEVLKSGDLIGWEPVVITPDMVGKTIARFLSVETKPEGWKPSSCSEHDRAQQAWAALVNREGGRAIFATGPGDL